MFCTQCGNYLPDGSPYCRSCGTPCTGGHKVFCMKCGSQVPGWDTYCPRCGTPVAPAPGPAAAPAAPSQPAANPPAPSAPTTANCPKCGAPLAPGAGDAVLTCAYCGTSVCLTGDAWASVTHTVLAIRIADQEKALSVVHDYMDKGILDRHLQEKSQLQRASFGMVPYWLIPASARTSVMINGGDIDPLGAAARELNGNYNFPVVAVKSLQNDLQPDEYQFALGERVPFQLSIAKGAKVLNGDVSNEAAKMQAKTLVTQLQYKKAQKRYLFGTPVALDTQVDVSDGELLHAPVWVFRYVHDEKPLVFVVDANSGGLIDSSQSVVHEKFGVRVNSGLS